MDPRVADQYDTTPGLESSSNGASEPQVLFGSVLLSTSSMTQHVNGTPQQQSFDKLMSSLGGVNSIVQSSLRDPWGHARLPIIDLLPGYDNKSNPKDTWLNVTQDNVLPSSAAFGIPVVGLPANDIGNTSFIIKSALQGSR
jgi:hypothetical protein